VAILSALSMVNQGLPSGATVIPNGSLPFTTLDVDVITPVGEMRAMLPPVVRMNHIEPSGPTGAMSTGPPSVGKSVTLFVPGSRRPAAYGGNRSVNHTAPSLAMLNSRGKPSTSISVMTPVAGSRAKHFQHIYAPIGPFGW
jgi:hypothetical protein